MNITIYLNKSNSELIAQEPNKGGLINKLLAEHYHGDKKVIAGDKLYVMNGKDPLTRYDLTNKQNPPKDLTMPEIKIKSVGKPTNEFCEHGNMEDLCPKCGSTTVVIDSTPVGPNAFHKLTTDNVSSNLRPDIKQCPHGYAIGMCKKSDCNRKYKK